MFYAIYAVTSARPWSYEACFSLGLSYYCTLYIDDGHFVNIVAVPIDWVPNVITDRADVWAKFSALGFRSYVQITTSDHNPFVLEV